MTELNQTGTLSPITIYTIGSNRKPAEEFFMLLTDNGVRQVIDVRLNNDGPFLGFTRQTHLPYLLKAVAGIEYEHRTELAPDESIFDPWKAKQFLWPRYEELFIPLLRKREVEKLLEPDDLDRACLLCTEPTADKCHRRLVAEYLQSNLAGRVQVEIVHL